MLQLAAILLLTAQGDATAQLKARGEALYNQGLDLFDAGKLDEARQPLEESLRIHRELRDGESETQNLRALALLSDGLGERQTALQLYQQALDLARRRGDKYLEANTLRDMGGVYYNLDVNDRALECIERALAIHRQLNKPGVLIVTLFNIGELRRYQGDNARARVTLEEVLELARKAKDRKMEGDALSSLAMVRFKLGDREECFRMLQEALKIRAEVKQPRGEASTLVKLGLYYVATGDVAAARDTFRKSAAIFEQIKYRGGEAFTRQNLAILERREGNLETAATEMRRAIELAETLRTRLSDRDLKAVYSGYVQNRYEFLIDVLMQLGRKEEALEVSERARARSLYETLESAGIRSKDGAESGQWLTTRELQKDVLDEDTVLVEYALGVERSFLFIATPQALEALELPARDKLEKLARSAYSWFASPGARPPEMAELSRVLLAAVMQRYRGKRLVIVADGALQYLPFAALAKGHRVVLAPSASTIAAFRHERPRQTLKQVAVIADPVTSLSDPRLKAAGVRGTTGTELARLPFSRMEAETILNLSGKAGSTVATGFDATRELVMGGSLKDYRILHFAAHSIMRTDQAELSELVLSLVDSSGATRNGHVRLKDIYGLKLSAELVVLSACQTALGREMKREGLIGLTRGFQFAGASRVIASLWKVDDRATAELMKWFYRGLLVDKKAASEALAVAQEKMAATNRWAHPYYWAGFVLQGEWR